MSFEDDSTRLTLFALGDIIECVFFYNLTSVVSIKIKRSQMEYLSISQTAEKWGITRRRVQILCNTDRIPGATKIGSYWAVPADAVKPKDERVKSGKYIKQVKQ